jgi:type II secretory pathway component PulF
MRELFPTFRKLSKRRSLFGGWGPRRTLPSQSRALLRLLTLATEQHLPLAPLLEAWAEDERGAQKVRVARLAELIRRGTPLSDAVEQAPDALGDAAVLAIRFGVQSGTLAPALREAQADVATEPPTSFRRWTFAYFGLVSLLFTAIVAFIYIKIIPSVLEIAQDFDLEPPLALRISIRFADLVQRFWWVFALLGLLAAWSAVSARPGRFLRHSVLGNRFGPFRNLRSAEVLEKLSLAAAAGRPLTGAVSTLARYHFDPSTRQKLLFVRNEVEQGADLWGSLRHSGLLTPPEEKLLITADRVGNRPWMLRLLAAWKKRRTLRKLDRLSELLLPVLVIALGAFVLLQALSVLAPLVQLINNLS